MNKYYKTTITKEVVITGKIDDKPLALEHLKRNGYIVDTDYIRRHTKYQPFNIQTFCLRGTKKVKKL